MHLERDGLNMNLWVHTSFVSILLLHDDIDTTNTYYLVVEILKCYCNSFIEDAYGDVFKIQNYICWKWSISHLRLN